MIQDTEITWVEFCERFKPIKNHFVEDTPWCGYMFETYGEEFAFVQAHPDANVWTWVDTEDEGYDEETGELYRTDYIISGQHHVNRMGYFITEIPVPAGKHFTVKED